MKRIYIFSMLAFLFAGNTKAQDNASATAATDSLKVIVQQAEKGNAVAQNIVGTWYYNGKHYAQDYGKAFQWWSAAAAQKNVEAYGNLGLLYQYGRGVERDSVKALRLYVSSINGGNKQLLQQREALAEKGKDNFNSILAGICYQEGKGVAQNTNRAIQLFSLAAKNNSADAYRELGFIYQRAKKEDVAQRMFANAAKLGDIPSAYQYAKTVIKSKSATPAQSQEAVSYLIKAAEAGNLQAQCDLGMLYYQGNIVTKDMPNAVKWFKTAATGGWPMAQWNLALCLIDGNGTERNYDEAIYWLGEATAKGYMKMFTSQCNDSEKGWKDKPFMTYLKGMSLYFAENKDVTGAYETFKEIRKDVPEAQIMMSVCLANKSYKKPNAKKAFKELAKVAETGNAVAQFYVASLYEAGNGTDKDTEKAVQLYKQAADGGYAVAQCYLGDLFYEGRLTKQSYADAVRYYQMAEAQGQLTETAALRYAQCLTDGLGGLTKDAEKAEALKKRDFKNHVIPMLRTL